MNTRLNFLTFCSAIAALVTPYFAQAAAISIQAGDPRLPGVVSSIWRSPLGDVIHDFEMPVQNNMTSSGMAAVTLQNLLSIPGVDPASATIAGDQVHVTSTPLLDPLDGVLPGGSIYWSTGTTAQASMTLSSPDTGHATIAAAGHFDPFFQPLQPAIFTAGIVTDVGTLSTNISAQELNFQTDGPIICQALFQRLAPRAPQYGAQINYAGDRLEVYFDPAYTVTQGGIIFGTTSPSPGFSGTLTTPPAPIAPIPGDYNGDGVVDAADYVVWRDLLGQQVASGSGADGNGDGVVDPLDLEVWESNFGRPPGSGSAFGAVSVPEPAVPALILSVSFALPFGLQRRRTYPRRKHQRFWREL